MQSFNGLAIDEMTVDDFVNISLAVIAIPDALWIDGDRRAFVAASHAAGRVDADTAGHSQSELFDPVLGIVPHCRRIMILATGPTVLTLVGTEKNMIFVIHQDKIQDSGEKIQLLSGDNFCIL